jgi:hypothetical protein
MQQRRSIPVPAAEEGRGRSAIGKQTPAEWEEKLL